MANTEHNVFTSPQEGHVTVASGSGILIQEISLSDYNALGTRDANTLYLVTS